MILDRALWNEVLVCGLQSGDPDNSLVALAVAKVVTYDAELSFFRQLELSLGVQAVEHDHFVVGLVHFSILKNVNVGVLHTEH